MRRLSLLGIALVIVMVLTMAINGWLDLELESLALLGVAVGGVLAVVPARTPAAGSPELAARVAGFGAGVAITLVCGYLIRAALLPDAPSGRTVAFALVLAGCAAVAVLTRDRLPLWALLLGAGAFFGAYEPLYVDDPPRVVATSLTGLTALLFCAAMGFVATLAVLGPERSAVAPDRAGAGHHEDRPVGASSSAGLNDLLREEER